MESNTNVVGLIEELAQIRLLSNDLQIQENLVNLAHPDQRTSEPGTKDYASDFSGTLLRLDGWPTAQWTFFINFFYFWITPVQQLEAGCCVFQDVSRQR